MAWAPDFTMKFSSVHVNPDRKKTAGTFPCAACGGMKVENRIGVPHVRDSNWWKATSPSKHFDDDRVFIST
jgi:hypothetical protein